MLCTVLRCFCTCHSERRRLYATLGFALSALDVDHLVRCVLCTVIRRFCTCHSERRRLYATSGFALSSLGVDHPVRCVLRCAQYSLFFVPATPNNGCLPQVSVLCTTCCRRRPFRKVRAVRSTPPLLYLPLQTTTPFRNLGFCPFCSSRQSSRPVRAVHSTPFFCTCNSERWLLAAAFGSALYTADVDFPSGACCAQYSAVFVPATPNGGTLLQPSVLHFLQTLIIPYGACCAQYFAIVVPATPNDGPFPQRWVLHFLLLTSTIPSGACCAQYSAAFVLPLRTMGPCRNLRFCISCCRRRPFRPVRAVHSTPPILYLPLRTMGSCRNFRSCTFC